MDERRIYCLVPRELAGELHDPLRRHFADHPEVEVVIERRRHERRSAEERRSGDEPDASEERRRVRNAAGRRVGERRAALVPLHDEEVPSLPRRARRDAERIAFVERLAPSAEGEEDLDTARLVTRIQGGERELFTDLYLRYFDRVYGYLRVLVRDRHEAEDLTQQVFAQLLETIDRYERRRQPFRAWLFTNVKNLALTHLRRHAKIVAADPAEVARMRDESDETQELRSLNWIADRDLLLFVERLPLAQRQVLSLRFMLDLTDLQTAAILGRSREDVRALQHRAVTFLRARLTAIGRAPERRGGRAGMRSCPNQAFVLRERRFSLIR